MCPAMPYNVCYGDHFQGAQRHARFVPRPARRGIPHDVPLAADSTTKRSGSSARTRSSSRSPARATRRSRPPPACCSSQGYDWFYPYYRDRALCLQLGMTAAEMLYSAVGAARRSELGRAPDAVALGPQASQHRVGLVTDGHAVPAGRGRRRGDAACRDSSASPTDSRTTKSCSSPPAKARPAKGSSGSRSTRRRTSSCPIVYLVEDNGYAISVPVEVNTAGGSISELVKSFPGLYVQTVDGCDLLASYDGHEAADRLRAGAEGSGARARPGHPPVLALALRRRSDVPSAGGARGGRRARSASRPFRSGSSRRATRPRRTSQKIRDEVDAEVLAATDDALAQPQPDASTVYHARLLARRRSRPASSSTPRTIRSSRAIRRRWSTC